MISTKIKTADWDWSTLTYGMDEFYSYHYGYSCKDYGCDNDYCCRCGQVLDKEIIKNIPFSTSLIKIREQFLDKRGHHRWRRYTPSIIEEYCFEILWSVNKMYDRESWYIDVDPGYYGEECKGIRYDGFSNKFFEKVYSILNEEKDIDKIKYIIKQEYNNILLDDIKKSTSVSIKELPFDKIQKNNEYLKRIKNCDSSSLFYFEKNEGNKFPTGIVSKDSHGIYHLIDGYHRLFRNMNNGKSSACFIVLSSK